MSGQTGNCLMDGDWNVLWLCADGGRRASPLIAVWGSVLRFGQDNMYNRREAGNQQVLRFADHDTMVAPPDPPP